MLYWANNTNSNVNAFDIDIMSEDQSVHPADRSIRYRGFAIRCIAAQEYTLTVNPNGGTWSGGTDTQYFDQEPSTTKNISNPTGPTYSISYDMSSTGIPAPSSPTSTNRAFTSWATSGSGTLVNGTYTFGEGNGALLAQYDTNSVAFTMPTVSKTGHNCHWTAGGVDYDSGQTGVKISGNTTFTAVCAPINYTVSVTNSNTTSGAASISVPYGGSATVTVTPNSGYYLSAVSCPSGYTCTGYNTGTSATGTQTVTVTNNNSTNTGTLSFTGTLAQTLQQACTAASVGGTFTYNSIKYVKLKTNSAGTTSACYTKSSQGTATWANASSLCPSGTGVPSQTDFSNLITAYGNGSGLNSATGWGPGSSYTSYWSSTEYISEYAYVLQVRSSSAYVFYGYLKAGSTNVVCIVR